ncbi:hypothetical protein JVU11DRAFT_9583 [Chiua virens]|nr:hypothetical protein JVU11DRAFT_9583 [Chiua virens]
MTLTMLIIGAECDISVGSTISAVAFTPDGKYLVSGGKGGVQVWGLQGNQPVTRMPMEFIKNESVQCVVASKDGRLIAAGTGVSVYVWDAKTYVRVFKSCEQILDFLEGWKTNAVDFSPDSTGLVAVSGHTATVWEVASWSTRLILEHSHPVIAAKFSPLGDRIAIATSKCVRLYNRNNGRTLFRIPTNIDPVEYNHGLVWSRNHLFVISKDTVVKLDISARSAVSRWTVPVRAAAFVALPHHGRFIACSTNRMITLWDASTHTQFLSFEHVQDSRSITFSQDDRSIAMIGKDGKIKVKRLSAVIERALTLNTNLDSLASTMLLTEWAVSKLMTTSWKNTLAAAVSFVTPKFALYRAICEYLEKFNRVLDAVECFHRMGSELAMNVAMQDERVQWTIDFRRRCIENLVRRGDAAVCVQRHDNAIIQYSAALSLNPCVPQDILIRRSKAYMARGLWANAFDDTNHVLKFDPLSQWSHDSILREWAKIKLTDSPGTWKNALSSASAFKVSRFTIYKTICEHLSIVDRITDVTECLHEMKSELGQKIEGREAQWICDFKSRSCKRLQNQGDAAMTVERYEEATSLYSTALSLNPIFPQALLVKRSKAYAARGMWDDAMNDINETITLDPPASLPSRDEKHVELHGAGRYQDAFEELLVKMSLSTDADIRERCRQYKNTRKVIRTAVQDAIRDLPRVLINTTTGGLCDKTQQAAAFESLPIFTELVTLMIPHIDHNRIKQKIARHYRYAMFSHKWEDDEPLFERVIHVAVHDLGDFPTHVKLQMFCKIARDSGFHWAWSDTCCINKADPFVTQEALMSMFNWYQGSSLTIVFLRDVRSPSRRGDLMKSIWNTRAWTFQEYHASKVVRFYNVDWTPYMNLDVLNHKESGEIILEMEEAIGVSAHALTELRPGLDRIREKLCLASRRETTFIEDAAYSLFGIFSVTLPVVYGERDQALGRLLAQLLASSGDTSILGWTGRSGSFNSCLPVEINVFSQLPTAHIPPAIQRAEMDRTTSKLQTSALNITSVMNLSDRLHGFPVPSFSGKRMKLPCISFAVTRVFATQNGLERVFHVKTDTFGDIEVRTTADLSRLDSLILVHPWIDFLLDRRPVDDVGDTNQPTASRAPVPGPAGTARRAAGVQSLFGGWLSQRLRSVMSFASPSFIASGNVDMQALEFLARLREPFGALLLAPIRRNVAEYRRVAADCIIRVQIREDISLDELLANVRTLDVL